jgi:hypothetical protein
MTNVKRWTVDSQVDEHEEKTRAQARLHGEPEAVLVGVGFARLSPGDRNVPEIGDELAMSRALADLAHKLLEAAVTDIEAATDSPAHLSR